MDLILNMGATIYFYEVMLDATQQLWIGTNGAGIMKLNLRPQPFRYYGNHTIHKQPGSARYVRDLYADRAENLWLSDHQNFYFVTPENGRLIPYG